MKKRILMRAGKSPFEVLNAYQTFEKNVIGNNNGNLVFASAAYKLLSAINVGTIDCRLNFNKKLAEEVNSNYDFFVLPLTNAFRSSFEKQLIELTEFIDNLKIPVV